jgi:hypothetical protein
MKRGRFYIFPFSFKIFHRRSRHSRHDSSTKYLHSLLKFRTMYQRSKHEDISDGGPTSQQGYL